MSSWLYKDGLAVPPPEPPPLTIFDVFRKLIGGDPWAEGERREAYRLIAELEVQGVFGNRAREITTDDVKAREENDKL